MPNQTHDKITQAQKLKDQFKYEEALAQTLNDQSKYKEALEILSSIKKVNELTVEDQISFYLLQSSLFRKLRQYNKAIDAADKVIQKSIQTGNDLGMLDASLTKGWALYFLGKDKECYVSILKCEELISRIKDQPEKIIGKRKADLSCLKGWYYHHIGKFDKALEYLKTGLALSEKCGIKRDIAYKFFLIGFFYFRTGDFTKALENYEKSLKISKEIDNKYRMSAGYITKEVIYYIGWIYYQRGDLDRALEYFEQNLSLIEKKEHKFYMAGPIFYEKGELTKALNYVKRTYQLMKEIGGSSPNISFILLKTILIYLDQNDLESARICLEEMKNLSEKEENKDINHMYRIAKALILKKTGGNRNIIKAEDILKELLEDSSIESLHLVIILLNLCELLYKELQISNETEILEEIPPLITRLEKFAEKMQSFLLLAEVNIFKAKLELINLELDEAQRFLTKAQQIAQEFALSRLEKKISMEHDQLLEKLDIWKELKKQNAPISERLKLISLEGDLNLMMRKKEIEQVEILPEEPQLLSIISNGGVSLFTHFFSKKWDDIMMFGSFMTAFNMFSNQFFSKTLDRVKIGESTIIMAPFEDKFLCYVIKGQTYPAQQKLNKFSEGIKNSKEILDAINRSFSTGAILNEENTPVLGELVNTIFA